MNNSGTRSSFLGEAAPVAQMFVGVISMQEPSVIPELTLAVTAAAAWMAQKVARTLVLPVSAGLLHTQSVSRKDNRELAAPCLRSLGVCLQYSMCHAVVGGCQCIERADYFIF